MICQLLGQHPAAFPKPCPLCAALRTGFEQTTESLTEILLDWGL